MLKNLKNLKGAQVLTKDEQKKLIGGGDDIISWGFRCYWESQKCILNDGYWESEPVLNERGICGHCVRRDPENSSF